MKKPQQFQCFVGIDVSKLVIDVTALSASGVYEHEQFENSPDGFHRLASWLGNKDFYAVKKSLFCLEHTGLYTRRLVSFLLGIKARVWMESALQMKRSIGMIRGKTDKADSYRIAKYALSHQDQAVCVSLASSTLQRIKDLMANRVRLIRAIKSLKTTIKELSSIDRSMGRELEALNASALKGLIKSRLMVECRMRELISQDPALKRLYELVTSVKCVGSVLATELLVYTHGFTRMENSRQLACYCGVAPFEHSSGTSIRGRTGTSNFANMGLKSTLHMAAVSATRYVPDIKQYYERKVAEGKHKMAVINAIRGKLLNRIMAVVKRGTPYEENYMKISLPDS
jgi:transposase